MSHASRTVVATQVSSLRLRFCAAVMYSLPVLAFTFPGRPVQAGLSGDPLTLMKLVTLASTLLAGVGLLLIDWRSKALAHALKVLLPFFVFLGWAIASVAWSPLRSVTLNQAGGLTALLLFALHVSCVSGRAENVSWLLKQLCYSLLLYSALVFGAFLVNPSFSGLERSILWEGEDGLIHPTAAGSTAAIAIVLTTICWLSGKFPWAARLILPAMLIHGPTLYFSHSRSALAMAAISIVFAAFYFGGRKAKSGLLLAATVMALAIMVFDPGLHVVAGDNALVGYLLRGQDMAELSEGSGRAEMWQAIWGEFQDSGVYLKGHGYFVTSRTGELYVWYQYANHIAHNLLLQILVTTGAIGFTLWSLALLRIGACISQLRHGDTFARTYLAILCLALVWLAGWSIGSTSFMGPVRSESVFWFTLAGVGIGLVSRNENDSHQTRSNA